MIYKSEKGGDEGGSCLIFLTGVGVKKKHSGALINIRLITVKGKKVHLTFLNSLRVGVCFSMKRSSRMN